MIAPFNSILKTILQPKKSIFKQLKVDNNKLNRFGISGSCIKISKKSRKLKNQKLSKLRKSKSEKLAKSKK